MLEGCESYKDTGLYCKELQYQHPYRLLVLAKKEWSFTGAFFPQPFAQYLPSNYYFMSAIKKNYQVHSSTLKKEMSSVVLLTFQ